VGRPLPAVAAALALALSGAAPAAAQTTLDASVGGGATSGVISLLLGGNPFVHGAPGNYSVQVQDTATIHNFHLTGPGVDQATSVDNVESVTWPLTLGHGFYDFLCDVHPDTMRGSFAIGNVVRVQKAGSGSGTVTSSPAGIACGGTCRAAFPAGGDVTLTAAPATGSTFTGWSGGCSGSGDCVVAVDGLEEVTATFASSAPPGPSAKLLRTAVAKAAGVRVVSARLSVVRRTAVTAAVRRKGRTIASAKATFAPGTRTIRVKIPRRFAPGPATLRLTLEDTTSGAVTLVSRPIRLPRV
jgi:hypothetical protein